ncbi:MAG: exo-alpha-sialidase, partial [Candidatus Omnitrophica bacterium]|nr:exo-alpha-sialidase [Candidatus Omnitrophota bacterium]
MPPSQVLRHPLIRLSVLFAVAALFGSAPSPAQRSYPGWSAPKEVLPSEYNNATYPDIAAEGDTLHVVFRATFTVTGEGVGPSEEQDLINRIVDVNQLLRGLRYTTAVESAGGMEKLRDLKKQLEDRLREVQEEQERTVATTSGPPVQTALYYTRSDDRGRTWWKKPIQVVYNPESFLGQTSLTVDRQGLHVVYSAASGENVLQIFSIHSTDGGKTWSKPLQVSESPYRKFSPQVSTAPGNGLLACWWELEETEVATKTRPDLDALNDLLLNPLLTTTRQARTRVTIHYARYVGGSWMADQVLDTASVQLPYLNLRNGLKGENYIYWLGDAGMECRVSRNGGVAWESTIEFAQVLNRENYNTFCPGGGELQFIRAHVDRRRSGQLFHREGLFGADWRNIIDNQTQYSYPEVDYTRDETQVIWGVTDPSGNHLLFFREDNKPPTSELTYPPDGDFAKYEITFIWSATDDIATRLDYRYVLMNRKDPNVRPEPHNFPLYAADNHYAIKANPDGYYTLYVQARDFSGNEEPKPTTFDYHTFYVSPKIQVNPDTLPPIKIQTRNIEIRWSVEDNTPSQSAPMIAYRLDGEPVTEFAPRTSVRIAGLRDGWHQVQLYAVDSKGNVSTFGDTVSVEVDLQLTLNWRQIPVQPREGPRVYVREDSVPLSWVVTENTEDKNIGYFSSYEVVHDGKTREYSPPQANLETVLV